MDNDMLNEYTLNSPLESSKSTRISLENIRIGEAGLNKHRQNMLNRVPEKNDWSAFKRDSIEIIDLAYLHAATGHEFALLRSKRHDILFHGSEYKCDFKNELYDALETGKYYLVAHSHPDMDKIIPLQEDREFLALIGQEKSIIISAYTGRWVEFFADESRDI